jgi:excisionase family DNA binding protein
MADSATEVSVNTAARLAKCSPDTILRWIEEGRFEAWRTLPRGWWRVNRESLLQYLKRCKRETGLENFERRRAVGISSQPTIQAVVFLVPRHVRWMPLDFRPFPLYGTRKPQKLCDLLRSREGWSDVGLEWDCDSPRHLRESMSCESHGERRSHQARKTAPPTQQQ